MKSTTDELTRSLQKIGEQVYQRAQAQPGAGAGAATGTEGPGSGKSADGDVVDADFKEV
jgi:hypothetical protein